MMRALWAGVSGLQNHQTRMDVVGNNISNVNTTGFKRGRVEFQDMLSQTLSGAAKPTTDVGGVNPLQVGLGMMVKSIDTIHTQGALQSTGVVTDMALQGNGMRVQGWMARTVGGEQVVNVSAEVEDLVIPVGSKDPAKATTDIWFACNLNKVTPEIPAGATEKAIQDGTWNTSFDVYDSFGVVHKIQANFQKVTGVANRWQVDVTVDPDAAVATNTRVDVGAANNATNRFFLDFDNFGTLAGVRDAQGDAVNAGALQVQLGFDVPNTTVPAGAATVRQTLNMNLGDVGAFKDAVTQFAEASSTKAYKQNGYTMGYLETFKIDQSGTITGAYTNGSARTIGQVALATFANPGGLEKEGENTYVVSNNSGAANIGPSGIAGKGKVIAGTLEMSNVDLAQEFVDMIVTQRGFQANSRTITTTDTMLQELLNLKR